MSEINFSKRLMRSISVLPVVALAITSLSATATEENLDCLKLSEEEKFQLSYESLSVSIRNSRIPVIKYQAENVLKLSLPKLIEKCNFSADDVNFLSNDLTKMTAEEVQAEYHQSINASEQNVACQLWLPKFFVPALIVTMADASDDSSESRAQMKQVLNQMRPSELATE